MSNSRCSKRNRWVAVLFPVLMLLLFVSGSFSVTAEEPEQVETKIYFLNAAGTEIVSENHSVTKGSVIEMAMEALHLMQEPKAKNLLSAFPQNVSILDVSALKTGLTVNFQGTYSDMSPLQEVLFRCAVVRTLTSLPDVSEVLFEVESKPFRNSNGEIEGAMTAENFVDPRSQAITTYRYASLILYFAKNSEEGAAEPVSLIRKEKREVHYANTTSLEWVVVRQILRGPSNTTEMQSLFPEDIPVLDVVRDKDLITITFGTEFLTKDLRKQVDPETAVYALVNSLCDSCLVERVKILVEGNDHPVYGGKVDLSGEFTRNGEWIEQEKLKDSIS